MKIFGKIVGNIVMVFAIIVVIFFVAMMVLPKFDYGLVFIKSGSMEPTIKTGSAVIIKSQEIYNTDDVVTFVKNKGDLVTHRIIDVINEDGGVAYTTKGDNNNAKDVFSTKKENVRGKVIFNLPYLGYLIVFFQSRLGIMLLILIPVGYFIGREIVKIKKEMDKKKDNR